MKYIMKYNKKENWNHLFEYQLALEGKVETFLTTRLQKNFKISLTKKPKCKQVILWEKRKGISQIDKITLESKTKDNSNQLSESKVKDNSNKLLNKVKDLQTGKID
ncbi:hypothetical protein RhiirA4_480211 [Rhizophagus irregularis]|uniref:Uncharacterized protein n=1 Tax=Rhizophagus irregularis TaxID=588596 RepID=A0A2I1HHR1_9GLOM|nr:hypothetical protein RhiirA4_480211 [Rhizophagus irregularis]